jgi:hypothetical protein
MKAEEFPYDPLTEQEFAALCEMIKGKTINEAARTLMRKFGISFSQAKRRRRTAIEKLGLKKERGIEAAYKAVWLELVSFEDVARHYKFPLSRMSRLAAKRQLIGTANHSFLSEVEVDVGNPEEVNSWLAEEVVKRTPRPAQWDPEKLYASISRFFTNARNNSITYSPHDLAFKTRPYFGYYTSLSSEFDRALLLAYIMEGPRLLFMGGSGSDTFPYTVVDDLTKAIIDQGDEKAMLTLSMLDNRRQYLEAFRAQADKWLHLDICPMSAIDRFICHGEIARDSWLPYLEGAPIKPDHVKEWLINVKGHLLEYEDTYHLALLDDRKYSNDPVVKSIWQDFWAVKVAANKESVMLWEEWPVNAQGQRREVDHKLTELDITSVLGLYGDIWKYSPEDMLIRDKGAVFKYLTDQGKKLPRSYN